MIIKIGNKQIMEITPTEIKCLKNDLIDPEDWFKKALGGKINQCKKRLIREWYPRLIADLSVTSIPGNEEDLLNFIFSHPDYKNRATREAEGETP